MKTLKTIAIIVIIAFNSNQVDAQNADAKITKTKIVNTSADNIWKLLRKMDDIQKYSSTIATVKWTGPKGKGGNRICTAADGKGYFKENILEFNDTQRSYTYAVVEGIPAKGMVNNFKVVDLGYNKSMIVWTSKFDMFIQNPQMTEKQFFGFIDMNVTEMMDKVSIAASK